MKPADLGYDIHQIVFFMCLGFFTCKVRWVLLLYESRVPWNESL